MSLHDAIINKSTKALEEKFLKYRPENRLEQVLNENFNQFTVLQLAIEHPESLRIIFNLLPEPDRLKAVLWSKYSKWTVSLLDARKNLESFKIMLDSLTDEDFLRAIKHSVPEYKRVAFYENNFYGRLTFHETKIDHYIVLEKIATKPKLLEIVLARLQEPQLKTILNCQLNGDDEKTLFTQAATNHECLEVIFNRLQTDGTLIQYIRDNIVALLYYATEDHESLAKICHILPKDELIQHIEKHSNPLLFKALENAKSLEILLNILPQDKRLLTVANASKTFNHILTKAANKPAALRIILSLYPEHIRVFAIAHPNTNLIETPLKKAWHHRECLDVILELIPIRDQWALFMHKKPPIYSRRGSKSPTLPSALICNFINQDSLEKFPSINMYKMIHDHIRTSMEYNNTGLFFDKPIIHSPSDKLWHDIDEAQNLQGIKDALVDFLSEDTSRAQLPDVASLISILKKDPQNPVSTELLSTIDDTLKEYHKPIDYLDPAEYRFC